jgi:hypothetical protein
MKNVSQIQSAQKPAKDKISAAYQYGNPRPQMSWGKINTSQHIEENNQIAREVI